MSSPRRRVAAAWRGRAGVPPLTLPRRVLVVLDEARQAEVGDLAHQVVSHQDVGGAEIPVDVVHPLNIRHARRDLGVEQ